MSNESTNASTLNNDDYIHVILEVKDKYRFIKERGKMIPVNRKKGTIRWYIEEEKEDNMIDMDKIIFPFEIEAVHIQDLDETTGDIIMKRVPYRVEEDPNKEFHTDMVFGFEERVAKWRSEHPDKVK